MATPTLELSVDESAGDGFKSLCGCPAFFIFNLCYQENPFSWSILNFSYIILYEIVINTGILF